MFFLAAVVVGGQASILGSILGAAFMTLMPEILRALLELWGPGGTADIAGFLSPLREFIFGALIVGFLMFEPRGLAGLIHRMRGSAKSVRTEMPRDCAETNREEDHDETETAIAAPARSRVARACAPAAAQDIKFSLQLPLTGPVAFTGQLNQAGWQHAIDWINKNGGVKGRKLDPYIYDYEYKVDVGIAGWKKAIANGDMVFSVGDGTPFVRAVSPENNDRYKIMMTNTGYASDVVDVVEVPVSHHGRADLFRPDRHPLQVHQGQAGLRSRRRRSRSSTRRPNSAAIRSSTPKQAPRSSASASSPRKRPSGAAST